LPSEIDLSNATTAAFIASAVVGHTQRSPVDASIERQPDSAISQLDGTAGSVSLGLRDERRTRGQSIGPDQPSDSRPPVVWIQFHTITFLGTRAAAADETLSC
jgi:hypothetical protein